MILWAVTIGAFPDMRKQKELRSRYSPSTVLCSKVIYVTALSLLLLKNEETLPGLPFLIGVLASGRLQKLMVIPDRRCLVVQCIV